MFTTNSFLFFSYCRLDCRSLWPGNCHSTTKLINWKTARSCYHQQTHTHPFNGPLSGTTRVSRYQKGETNLDFTEARDSEWQWHQLNNMPAPHHSVFYRPDALPAAQPTASKHFFHFASAFAVSNQWTTRSSAVWSCCKPPSNHDNGHESTIWLMVCFCPQLQDSDVHRPHWCKSAWQVPRPVRKRFSIDQVCRGRSKPGCQIVGSGTKDWLTTGADVQTSLHWAFMSTGVMSDDQIGLQSTEGESNENLFQKNKWGQNINVICCSA